MYRLDSPEHVALASSPLQRTNQFLDFNPQNNGNPSSAPRLKLVRLSLIPSSRLMLGGYASCCVSLAEKKLFQHQPAKFNAWQQGRRAASSRSRSRVASGLPGLFFGGRTLKWMPSLKGSSVSTWMEHFWDTWPSPMPQKAPKWAQGGREVSFI